MKLRNLYIKWQVWRGKALDIWSKNPYPANVLSNLCSNEFRFEGVQCGSMEGFLQSLKYQDTDKQRLICSMKGKDAKNETSTHWQTDQIIWWKGSAINRQSKEFQDLIRKAYKAMFEQNERFRIALMSTHGMKLYHSQGEQNPYKTILTESEFCSVLTEIRESYDINNTETAQRKKRLYFDMDGVLVDFTSALAKQNEETLKEYEGREDEIPGLFGQMEPMNGAIDAVHRLSEHYDCYILSTAPWKNPSAWSDKVLWITRYLDDVFHKRMVITHCKNLCKGDILIDDRGKNGTSEFEGEWIQFGSDKFPDWKTVLDYLLPNDNPIKSTEDSTSVDFFNDLKSPDIDKQRVGSHFWIECRRMCLTLYKNNWGSEIDYKFREDGFIETIHSIPEGEMPKLMKLCNNAKSEKAIVSYLYDRFSQDGYASYNNMLVWLKENNIEYTTYWNV